jgi:hypothetical protein
MQKLHNRSFVIYIYIYIYTSLYFIWGIIDRVVECGMLGVGEKINFYKFLVGKL